MERHLPVFAPNFTRAAYRQLLERYAGFYSPVEEKLTALRSLGLGVFDESRRKCPLLQMDLQRLGLDASVIKELPLCQAIPELQSVSQGIGCMYVLEGSTLGGQIILRHLTQSLGLTAENGGAFFACYGAELGSRWKQFRAQVNTDPRSVAEADQIVASARQTFRCFHSWLGGELPGSQLV
jgi:heme oxygenase